MLHAIMTDTGLLQNSRQIWLRYFECFVRLRYLREGAFNFVLNLDEVKVFMLNFLKNILSRVPNVCIHGHDSVELLEFCVRSYVDFFS